MHFENMEIEGPILLKPDSIADERGWFSEVFGLNEFVDVAGPVSFVQHNQSFSKNKGTVRGLHFQAVPRAQGKLVKCIRGRILDVAVDIRRPSKSFGQHVSQELSSENGYLLWVPVGFAHGFATLEDDSEILYFLTDYYSPEHDRGVLWNDAALGIDWCISHEAATVSQKDRRWPTLRDLADGFQ